MTGKEMPSNNSNTEEHLRRVLHEKANTVHPGPLALDEIQARLDGVVVANATVTQLPQPRPIVRYMSLAAAGLIAMGGLAYYSQRRTVTNVDLAAITTTTAVIDAPTTTEPVPQSTNQPTQTTTAAINPGLALPTGPAAATKTEAATKFLRLLRMQAPVELVEMENAVSVRRPDDETEIVRLIVAKTSAGWAVTSATSEGVTAEIEQFDGSSDDWFTVSGEGRGFEASAGVTLISALDGSLLQRSFTRVGMPDPLPYSTDIEAIGSEQAWVIIGGDEIGEGAIQEFAAVPVAFVGRPDKRTFGVFRIASNDPDDGLNLRSSPGTDGNTVLATLPAGTPGIRRTTSMPVLVGDSVWREVVGPDGQQGWAHTNFLTALAPAVSDEELLNIGSQFANATQQDTHWAFPLLPWSERVQIAFAWSGDLDNKSFRFDSEVLKGGGVWGPDSFRNWAVPEASFGQQEVYATHRDFLSLPQGAELDVRIGTGEYAYDFEKSKVERFLPNLRSVVISDMDPNGPWSEVHLFVEPTTSGAQIVAIAVSHQIP